VTETLHVLDGQAAVEALIAAGFAPERLLSWDDVVHEGPCPAASPAETRHTRATYLARAFSGNVTDILAALERRDATLLEPRDEVVLWICRDVHDLVQVWQQAHLLRNTRARVTAVFSDDPFPLLTSERLRTLAEHRRPLEPSERVLLERAWSAFTRPDLAALMRLATEPSEFPFFNELTRRLFDEFPDRVSGLSRSQRQALEAIEGGSSTPRAVFETVASLKDPLYMGDHSFWNLLDELAQSRLPLIARRSGSWQPNNETERSRYLNQSLVLTDVGRDVLAGRMNWPGHRRVDRWIGGFRTLDGFIDSV